MKKHFLLCGLFLTATVTFAVAGSWPEVPGLSSPYPAGSTDLRASALTVDTTTYSVNRIEMAQRNAPATPSAPALPDRILRLEVATPQR